MTVWFRRWALGASLILISGCAGSQSTIGGAGAIPQALIKTQDAHLGSWILPEAKARDLIYFSVESTSKRGTTYILSLPQGELVGQINANGGLCSDNIGNVWIVGYPNGQRKELAEFAHGGVKPIRILRIPKVPPAGCAVDPTSGAIATISGEHEVAIYNSGSSQPKIVAYNKLYLDGLTYDGNGNLFILGGTVNDQKPQRLKIAELPKGATKIGLLPGFETGRLGYSGFEWDGKHLTEGDSLNEGGHDIFRYKVGRNRLKSRGVTEIGGYFPYMANYWIQGSMAVTTVYCSYGCAPIYLFNYPAGGAPIKTIGQGVVPAASGQVTISVGRK
ncbi:MAG: hypothetical protein WBX23_12105 [Candidatus Cybelea sp.]